MVFLRILLFPFACIYGLLTGMRNLFFDLGLLPGKSYSFPVISVGNLSAGGTGKTPHTEYLTELLREKYKVAILSRGYKRKTRGFILATTDHSQVEIGDEPMQYLKKFSDVAIAVDENRRRGISHIMTEKPGTEVILLDDAFQHRYVRPGLSILLTDYHHLYVDDYLIPTGLLREKAIGAKRADIIIITKTPKIFSPITRRNLSKQIKPGPHQRLFFSYVSYEEPIPFKLGMAKKPPAKKYNYIIMVAGVANSYPLQEHLKSICNELIVIDFKDHHQYTAQDFDKINREYQSIISKDKVIFTTEKDATRLDQECFAMFLDELPFYYVPIKVKFHDCDEVRFDKLVLDYVQKSIGSH